MLYSTNVSNSMPSSFSLIRLVPTVTVFAWCRMASTGRDIELIDSPRHSNSLFSMFRAVPFFPKSISKSEIGSRPDKYLSKSVRSDAISSPMATGKQLAPFLFLNSL